MTARQRESKEDKLSYRAMYIWSDGTEPTPLLRSKTHIFPDGKEPVVWGFDGSSTMQAPGDESDVVLNPVKVVPDPLRGGDDVLVLSECLTTDKEPHQTNTRAACMEAAERYRHHETWFGMEQEYTFFQDGGPLGFPRRGFPGPQGPYYCGVGAGRAAGREIVDKHSQACMDIGLSIVGTNAEVLVGQWEFQIGPLPVEDMADQLVLARWLLLRIAEDYGVEVSFDSKPVPGDWNGAGCHTNFSTKEMRENYDAIIEACEALGQPDRVGLHIANYGYGIEDRLTGHHETQRYDTFSYGVSDRGASIRIPWHVPHEGGGYAEDRRPNANCDPYLVTRLITETVCEAIEAKEGA